MRLGLILCVASACGGQLAPTPVFETSIDVAPALVGQCLPASLPTTTSCTVVAMRSASCACDGPGLAPMSSPVRSAVAADLAQHACACEILQDPGAACANPYDDPTPHWCSASSSTFDICAVELDDASPGSGGADILFSSGLISGFEQLDIVCF